MHQSSNERRHARDKRVKERYQLLRAAEHLTSARLVHASNEFQHVVFLRHQGRIHVIVSVASHRGNRACWATSTRMLTEGRLERGVQVHASFNRLSRFLRCVKGSMTDRVITIRDAIPTSIPVEQSYVADWSNFSHAGGGDRDEPYSSGEDYEESERQDSEASEDSELEGGDSGAPDGQSPSFLARVMNPFSNRSTAPGAQQGNQQGNQQGGPAQDPASQPVTQSAPQNPPYVAESSTMQDRTAVPDTSAARELVSALSEVTRSSNGDSLAELLDQIASSLRGIEVAIRALVRSSDSASQSAPSQAPVATGPRNRDEGEASRQRFFEGPRERGPSGVEELSERRSAPFRETPSRA